MSELTILNISGVDCYEKDGIAYLRLENVARGLGFTTTQKINGEIYENVRWQTVRKYLTDIGFLQEVAKRMTVEDLKLPEFIPENIFYRLAMKAKNETAEAFQAKVADEIIPSIRKHGGYLAGQETMSDEELMAKALLVAQNKLAEREKKLKFLETTVAIQNQQIAELQPKATYYDIVLQCEDAIPLTIIAKDYGWSANAMNRFLQENNVQYKVNGTWVLKNPHAQKGFTTTKTHVHRDRYQKEHATVHTYWTQKGRLFIYELMKNAGNLPLIEIDG